MGGPVSRRRANFDLLLEAIAMVAFAVILNTPESAHSFVLVAEVSLLLGLIVGRRIGRAE